MVENAPQQVRTSLAGSDASATSLIELLQSQFDLSLYRDAPLEGLHAVSDLLGNILGRSRGV